MLSRQESMDVDKRSKSITSASTPKHHETHRQSLFESLDPPDSVKSTPNLENGLKVPTKSSVLAPFVAMPLVVPSSVLLLVMPGATSSVLNGFWLPGLESKIAKVSD